MSTTKPQNTSTNNDNPDDNGKKDEISTLFTNDMEASLWCDNNTMVTSSDAVDQFNGAISHDHLQQLTEYVIDGAEALPSQTKVVLLKPLLKERGNVPVNAVINRDTTEMATRNIEDVMHWDRTNWVEGGYKMTADQTELRTQIEKRLLNDMGQQSAEGNRVFRSNVYTSMDVDAALALDNKSRVCKTGEVILEAEYAYSSPKINFSTDDNLTFVIVDHNDYDNSSLRFYLHQQPSEIVFTINETNQYDVIAAVGRYVRSLNTLVNYEQRKYSRYFIVLSNAQNPLRCSRCVVRINGNTIGDDYTKLRFGSSKQIAAATAKALNVTQNYNQFCYNYLEVDNNNTSVYTGIKTFSASVNTSYFDYTAWNNLTGTAITWPVADSTIPISRQKWNIQDYYTAVQYLVEYHYKVQTPYDKYDNGWSCADWSLQHSGSELYGSSTLPIVDFAVRIALDKKLCEPLNTKSHSIEHRGILANKLKTLANYRAGRLLSSISETFGSLFNLTKIDDGELVGLFNEILDAQTVGIYDGDIIMGMIGHVKYVPTSPDFIASQPRYNRAGAFLYKADPVNEDLLVEEYWPIATYWRSDAFGLPVCDELDFEVRNIPANTSIGWKDVDKKTYLMHEGVVAKITYQFNTGIDPVNANVIFQSKYQYNGTTKSGSIGMYRCPGIFNCDCVLSIKDKPSTVDVTADDLYPICTGNRAFVARLNKNLGTGNRAKLFG